MRTDPGRDPSKQVNEDSVGGYETPFGHLCVVCDGMGGHEGGREASTLALETIRRVFEEAASRVGAGIEVDPTTRPRELLREAVSLANRKVFELAQANAVGHPGSTVVAILLHAGGTEIAHVGDSRCYRIHQGQIAQVTRDHSMVQELVDAQVLTPAQAAAHPDANKITRALGMAANVEVEVRSVPVAHVAGDVFILCSDGLSDLVPSEDIVQIAATAPAAQAAGQLVDLANARGGHDNVSVVVVRARESATPHRAPAITESMPVATVVDPHLVASRVPLPVTPPAPAAPLASRVPVGPSHHATEPPLAEVRRARRMPAAMILAIILGVVGLGVGAVALWLVLPHGKQTPSSPFLLPPASAASPDDSAPSSPLPASAPVDPPLDAALEPLAPSPGDSPSSPAPPSLSPAPHRRLRGRPRLPVTEP